MNSEFDKMPDFQNILNAYFLFLSLLFLQILHLIDIPPNPTKPNMKSLTKHKKDGACNE